jgi:tartrate-resistant acid phosphatase type 5
MRARVVVVAAILLAACSGTLTAPDSRAPISILVFGDTGYDYNWLEAEDYENAFTGREFVIYELDDWIEDNLPIEDFDPPPMHFAEQTGGYVERSGMWPVAKAMQAWCAPAERCQFGAMLGDNIYDAGATAGADGRDDAERFADLLRLPYKGLQEQDPEFVIYPVLGNHDWDTSREGAVAQLEYLRQSPLYAMEGFYYRVKAAPDVELFAIDTTLLLNAETVYDDAVAPDGTPINTGQEDNYEPWAMPVGDEARMLAWLEESLAQSDARWKLVIGHHPIWSSSGTKHEEANVLRRLLMPVLCRYADAYLVGHDHTLEIHTDDCRTEGENYRNAPPLLQLISGAGAKQRPVHRPFIAWQDRQYPQKATWFAEGMLWGFAELVLTGDTATVHLVTTPENGSGETRVEFSHDFQRRSGQLTAVDN